MPLHVLGCVKEQSHHGRRQLLLPDRARLGQRGWFDLAQVTQGTLHLGVEGIEQIVDSAARFGLMPLAGECLPLFSGQGFATRICEQAIDHPGDVLEVKADGRDSGWTIPQQLGREILQQTPGLSSGLDERMSDRLQESGHSFDRTAKPRLR